MMVLTTSSGLYITAILLLGVGNVVLAAMAYKQRQLQIDLNKDRIQQNVDRMEQKIDAQETRERQELLLSAILSELQKLNKATSYLR